MSTLTQKEVIKLWNKQVERVLKDFENCNATTDMYYAQLIGYLGNVMQVPVPIQNETITKILYTQNARSHCDFTR